MSSGFAGAGRAEQAEQECAELAVLEAYLPQLGDDELASSVDRAVAAVAAQPGQMPRPKQTGLVMKAVAGRAEGGRVTAAVKAKLTS